MATISVIIPAYNSAAFVGETIASVESQERRPDELIVVDDGSTDGTAEVAERALAGITIPGRLIRRPNGGVAAARNTGALASRGELVTFVDADDILLPTHLRVAHDHLEDHPEAVAVFSDVREFDASGDRPGSIRANTLSRRAGIVAVPTGRPGAVLLGNGLTAALLLGNFITNSSMVIRRTALTRSGLFDESFPIGEDRDLYMRLSLIGSFIEVEQITVRQRRHPGSVMARRNNLEWAETSLRLLAAFRDRHPHLLEDPPMRRAFADAFGTWADIALREGSRAGWRGLWRAVRHCRRLGHPARPGLRHLARALRVPAPPRSVNVGAVVPRADSR